MLISFLIRIRGMASRKMVSVLIFLERLSSFHWHDWPFGRNPLASKEDYLRLAGEVRIQTYPEINEYEKETAFAIDPEWLHELALHTQVVIKDSPLCYAHGRVLYSSLSSYLIQQPVTSHADSITIWETGTARGFSALCMAKALQNQEKPGTIVSYDVLPHRTAMYWNCIDDCEGPKTRADLLNPWQDLLHKYILFHEGNTRLELPKMHPERIHFAFLDGAHTFKDVMFEFEQIRERQKKGDMIVYDDYTPKQFPGLVKAVDEICKRYQYYRTDLVAHPGRGYVVATKI